MLRKNYKNFLRLKDNPDPTERRENLSKEALRNSKFLPEPITYEDIDQAMMDWSEQALDLSFEGKKIPTIALYTNQRFEEYMQTWSESDDKKNLLLNFKTITREFNPKTGSVNGSNAWNIPGDRYYTMKREQVVDKNGQISYMDWKMKQPFGVDLSYRIGLVTGKIDLINMFNTLSLDIFKSGYSYLQVNGHYLYMKLEDPTDESETGVDARRYLSQVLKITVKAYIIQPDDLKVEEVPRLAFHMEELDRKKGKANVTEDDESVVEDNGLYYKPLTLTVDFEECENNEVKTRIPYNMVVKEVVTNNINFFKVTISGEEVDISGDFQFEEAELTKIWIKRINPLISSSITFNGYDKDVIYDENLEEEDEFVDSQQGEDLILD